MDIRTRTLAALRGEIPDQIPWLIYLGLFPRGESERRLRSQGLGFAPHHMTAGLVRPNVTLEERTYLEGDVAVTERNVRTPVGSMTEKRRTESGYGSSWVVEHMVKEPKDYETLEFFIRDTQYYPDYEGFARLEREIGADGLVIGSVLRAPFQRLWVEYTGLDRLILDLQDYPELVQRVLDAMLEKDRELWAIVGEAPTDFVWCPDNVSASVTGPRHFDRFLAPYYQTLADYMHPRGKKLVAHMDGPMRALLGCVARCPVDVIEAFTPAPTGDVTLAEARAAWKDKAISLNFPSSVHLGSSAWIRAVTLDLLKQAAPGNGVLFTVTENVPEQNMEASLQVITKTINEWKGASEA